MGQSPSSVAHVTTEQMIEATITCPPRSFRRRHTPRTRALNRLLVEVVTAAVS